MSKKALIILVRDAEELEVVTPADVLRRAGVSVTIAGFEGRAPVQCARNVLIVPDCALSEANDDYDVVILPGGRDGSKVLEASKQVGEVLRKQDQSGKLIATICAAAMALKANGIGLKKRLTSYPSRKDDLADSYDFSEDRVVVDGNLITSRGPGTAFEWSLKIVELLLGNEKVDEIISWSLFK